MFIAILGGIFRFKDLPEEYGNRTSRQEYLLHSEHHAEG